MRIAFYIYLGIVLFTSVVICFYYISNMALYKKFQDQLNYLKALKLAKHVKV